MTAIEVKVKHNGKVHDISLDPSQSAIVFKQSICEKTGVPLDRQKVMIKGGMLKDDSDLSKIGARPGQTFMLIGTAGELPKGPSGPITFLEDMTDSQLAEATKLKIGLTNLGNTCYLNSTLQMMRAIPELQVALNNFEGGLGGMDPERNLSASLRNLFRSMGETSEAFPPFAVLQILRQVAPQFAEMAPGGRGYAQQDAEEAYLRLVTALQNSIKGLDAPSADGQNASSESNFVDQYLTGRLSIKRDCPEAPNEEPSFSSDSFKVLKCTITTSTNEMISGITNSLNQQIEKHSNTLDRTAVYNETAKIDRLPAYLTTHFVRFYWRRDINKKTKIMRKVKFPFDLDVTPFLTDELKAKILSAKDKIITISKERDERMKIRRKAKARKDNVSSSTDAARDADPSVVANSTNGGVEAPRPADAMAVDTTAESIATSSTSTDASAIQPGGALTDEEELELRERERLDAEAAIDESLRQDIGCNSSGLYELVGIVTHKGAAADGGHYISWVRKDEDHKSEAGAKGKIPDRAAVEEWYKFDDEKVSVVPKEKIMTLDGGGEDSVAFILLYRSKVID